MIVPPNNDTIPLSGVVPESVVDGTGIRFTVFVQGCPHRCPGCHNPYTHPFSGGEVTTVPELGAQIAQNPLLAGVTFSGGEPFCYPAPLYELSKAVHAQGLDVWCYSGYTYEALKNLAIKSKDIRAFLNEIDVLVDGPYLERRRNLLLKFRGSENQRVIDLKTMRRQNSDTVILVANM